MDKNIQKPKLWKRFTAKMLDYSLVFVVLYDLLTLFSIHLSDIKLFGLLLFLPILFAPLEALLISCFGSTPGKALFGINVSDETGKKLKFIPSFKRSLIQGCKVFTLFHPISSLFSKKVRSGYDNYGSVSQPRALWKKFAFIAVFIGLFLSSPIAFETFTNSPLNVATASKAQFLKWKPFNLPEKDAKIQFPKEPRLIEKELDLPKSTKKLIYKEYVSSHEDEDIHFSISYTELPKSITRWGSSLVLKGCLDIVVDNLPNGTKVVEKHKSNFKEFPSLEYKLQGKSSVSYGRLLLIDNVLYKIDVTYPDNTDNGIQASIWNFLESFQPK